jgi:hypothetical protein
MRRVELSSIEYFNVLDARSGRVFKGGDQEWYGSWRQRMSGCGPTTTANMIWYLARAGEERDGPPPGKAPILADAETMQQATSENLRRADSARMFGGCPKWDKEDFLFLMNQTWKHVTPGRGGVNKAELLKKGAESCAASMGLKLGAENMDVACAPSVRPTPESVARFIGEGLAADLPVAFLNLHNGAEKQLEKWHWVTITALEGEAGAATLRILDNCNFLCVNLGRWLETTKRGGGFVRFHAR